jgi:hypothetical protein
MLQVPGHPFGTSEERMDELQKPVEKIILG